MKSRLQLPHQNKKQLKDIEAQSIKMENQSNDFASLGKQLAQKYSATTTPPPQEKHSFFLSSTHFSLKKLKDSLVHAISHKTHHTQIWATEDQIKINKKSELADLSDNIKKAHLNYLNAKAASHQYQPYPEAAHFERNFFLEELNHLICTTPEPKNAALKQMIDYVKNETVEIKTTTQNYFELKSISIDCRIKLHCYFQTKTASIKEAHRQGLLHKRNDALSDLFKYQTRPVISQYIRQEQIAVLNAYDNILTNDNCSKFWTKVCQFFTGFFSGNNKPKTVEQQTTQIKPLKSRIA